jgi:hypothetical protein
VAVEENDIVVCDHAKITMHGFCCMQKKAWRSCAAQRARSLSRDVTGLSYTACDHAPVASKDPLDRLAKPRVERFSKRRQRLRFLKEDAFTVGAVHYLPPSEGIRGFRLVNGKW